MSLVGDALRKARREAAQRDAERRGVLYSARISDPPARSNLGLGLILGAVIAIVATAAGGTVAWWLLRGGPSEPAGASAARGKPVALEAAPGAPEPAAEPDSVVPATAETPTNDRNTTEHETVTTTARASEPAEPEVREPAATPAIAGVVPTPDQPTDDEGTPQGFVGIEDGNEVYILEADLGTTVLSLDYIISRAEDPFAEVNGIEVHLGGVVGGFRVKAIEDDRVFLSDGRRTVVLRTP